MSKTNIEPDLGQKLKEIRERHEKSYPGLWKLVYVEQDYLIVSQKDSQEIAKISNWLGKYDLPTAEFIAHAKEDISFLLHIIEELRKKLDAQKTIDRLLSKLENSDFSQLISPLIGLLQKNEEV